MLGGMTVASQQLRATKRAVEMTDMGKMALAVGSLLEPLRKVENELTCAICAELMNSHEHQAYQFPCNCAYVTCISCIDNILKYDPRCPGCKANVSKRSIRRAPLPYRELIASMQNIASHVEAISGQTNSSLDAEIAKRHDISCPQANRSAKDDIVGAVSSRSRPGTKTSANAGCGDIRRTSSTRVKLRNCCALCPRRETSMHTADKDAAALGPLLNVKTGSGTNRSHLAVHEQCAMFADRAIVCDGVPINVARALKASRGNVCRVNTCQEPQATVRCSADGCSASYHYVCAVEDPSVTIMRDGSLMVYCPKHSKSAPQVDEKAFNEARILPGSTQDRDSDDECFVCGGDGSLIVCDNRECGRAYHVACAGLATIPSGDWTCPGCQGFRSDCNVQQEQPENQQTFGAPRHSSRAAECAMRVAQRTPKLRKRPASVSQGHGQAVSRMDAFNILNEYSSPVTPSLPSPAKRLRYSARADVVAATGLNDAQLDMLRAAARMQGIQVRANMSSQVSHIVVSGLDASSSIRRTVKLCKAIARGLPVVCFGWVEDTLSGRATRLEDYVHRCSRHRASAPLFQDTRFYFGNLGNSAIPKHDLVEIVTLGKGIVTHVPPTAHNSTSYGPVYAIRSDPACFSSATSRPSRAMRSSHLLTNPNGAKTVPPDWILDQCWKSV